ncbi:MAG: hypothetical protein RIG84_06880 [Roseovarius sp.]
MTARRLPYLIASALIAFGVSQGHAKAATLGPTPVLGGGEYSTGGGITVAVELRRAEGGGLALCGAWAESRRLPIYLRDKGRAVLARGSVSQGGRVILQGLEFLPEVEPGESYGGAEAVCIRAPDGARQGEALEIVIPAHEVERTQGGYDEGVGMIIRFGPSLAANPALKAGSLLPESLSRMLGTPEEQRNGTPR